MKIHKSQVNEILAFEIYFYLKSVSEVNYENQAQNNLLTVPVLGDHVDLLQNFVSSVVGVCIPQSYDCTKCFVFNLLYRY